jgi:hypothetical protein
VILIQNPKSKNIFLPLRILNIKSLPATVKLYEQAVLTGLIFKARAQIRG